MHGRLISLRPFSDSDITPAYIGWLNDPAVVRYSNQRFRTHTVDTCREYVKSFAGTDSLFLAVCRGPAVVGTMTAYVSGHHGTADMGILIGDPASWGKGIGTDAWTTVMRHLLARGDIRKVCGGTLRCNAGMVRIMKSSGMAPDGVRVAHEVVEGVPQDVLYFAMFRD
jgi:RimJ/RimL family protein N-acetyltransferase